MGRCESCSAVFLTIKTQWREGLTSVYPHVVLVVGGTGEGAAAAGLGAVVRPLPGVCSDVNLANVGGGEGPAAALHWAFKGLLSCRQGMGPRGECVAYRYL